MPEGGNLLCQRIEFNIWNPRLTAAIISSGIFSPDEGVGFFVVLRDEAVDRLLQVCDGVRTRHVLIFAALV